MSDDIVTDVAMDRVFVTVSGEDVQLSQEALGINMDTSNDDILEAVQGVISENLVDDDGDVSFAVSKAITSRNIYVYPKPVAG